MQIINSSFVATGLSSVLRLGGLAETITFSLSGTYAATVRVERAMSTDESAWEVLDTFSTANATVSRGYTGRPNDRFRMQCTVYTSGTAVSALQDEDKTINVIRDDAGNVLQEWKQGGATTVGVGAAAGGTAVQAAEALGATIHTTTITFTDMTLAVTDALAYASQKIYDFPEGRILILGSIVSLQWGVTTTRASTINDSAGLDFSLGSVAASSITLASTMVDMCAKISKTLSAATTAYNTAANGQLATAAQFDGTTTAVDMFLNVGFPVNTDIDGDGTLKVTGTVTFIWINVGDY